MVFPRSQFEKSMGVVVTHVSRLNALDFLTKKTGFPATT